MIRDVNPFVYSHPVAPDEIIDRDDETTKLLEAAVGGHYVRVYAPRKFGKTTLLRHALARGEREEGLIPILVDLYGVLSFADVAVRVERAYAKQLKGKLRARIEELLQATGLGLSLGALGLSAKLQIDPKVDPLPALHALLDLPLRLEGGGGYRGWIVFDEFQDITKVKGLDALLRSHIQFQGEVASYVFSGSEPAMMKELFERRERPLYAQASAFRLGRLRDQDIADYIIRRFHEGDRSVGDALNPLLQAARGHPQRTMLLAHRLWEEVPRGGTATLADWNTAHEKAAAELAPEFDAHWRRFGTNEQKALRAVIAGSGSPYRTRTLERLGLSKGTARDAITSLVGTAEIEVVGRTHMIVDPMFAEWIAALRDAGLAVRGGRIAVGDVMRDLRDRIAAEMTAAATTRQTDPSPQEAREAFARVGGTVAAFLGASSYETWQVLRAELIDVGAAAIRILRRDDDFDDDELIVRYVRRYARRAEHSTPPWELWLLTLDFYVNRLASSEDIAEDLAAVCGLLVEAIWRIDDFDWEAVGGGATSA
jgi:hypothetical protein